MSTRLTFERDSVLLAQLLSGWTAIRSYPAWSARELN